MNSNKSVTNYYYYYYYYGVTLQNLSIDTIRPIICEASYHHVTQVSRVIQVMLVIQVIQVIQVIRVILVILVIFNTVTHTWTDELTRQ